MIELGESQFNYSRAGFLKTTPAINVAVVSGEHIKFFAMLMGHTYSVISNKKTFHIIFVAIRNIAVWFSSVRERLKRV